MEGHKMLQAWTNFLHIKKEDRCSGVWSGPTNSLTFSNLPFLLGLAVSAKISVQPSLVLRLETTCFASLAEVYAF